MVIGNILLIVVVLMVFVWLFIEFKRAKHKLLAIFLIFLLLFTYWGFVASIKDKDINFKSLDGIKTAGQLYFAWLGNVFTNLKSLTGNAVKMDWKGEQTNPDASSKK